MSPTVSADSVYKVLYDVRQAWPNSIWVLLPFGWFAGMGAWLVRDQVRNEDSNPKLWLMALGWLFVGGLGVVGLAAASIVPYLAMRFSLTHGHYQVREGVVAGFVPGDLGDHQEETWVLHTSGGDFSYTYSPSRLTPGYDLTAAHGGQVHEGVRVRVFDVHGNIARLEIWLVDPAM